MTLPFLEKLLQVLSQGGFSSTYKYAVLLGLIDLCLEAGHPPTALTTQQLARRVVELYWPQVRTYPALGRVLGQNRGGQATIARLVADYRRDNPDQLSPPQAGGSAPQACKDLLNAVEWVLIEYPLPRLQRVGGGEERFLYEIPWDEHVSRAAFVRFKNGDQTAFDNRVMLVAGAAESLIALSAVIRPLIQQQWMWMVRSINHLPEAELDEFLFGTQRKDLSPLRRPLRALQRGRCFYCRDALSGESHVDHFLPWARYPDNGLDNLVLAHAGCNLKKSHFLADLGHGQRWEERNRAQHERLAGLAEELRWPRDQERTFGVVSSAYQGVPEGVRLWVLGPDLRRIDADDLAAVHAFGAGLLR